MAGGLRELKKQRTRRHISDTATRLFLDRGFEAVTIADVAAAAQVAKMTVTNYFPRKEDLALDHHAAFTAYLSRTVAERAAGESALAALRRAYLAAAGRHDAVLGFSSTGFARMIADSATLTTRLRDLHDLREQALAEVLGGDITAQAVAAVLTAAHRTLFQQVMELTREGRSNGEIAVVARRSAEQVFDLLGPALDGYAVR